MIYNFDEELNRRPTESFKWNYFSEDCLPMWVADMDFVSPEPVIQALQERIDHRIFGYGTPTDELSETICERMARLYNWDVTPNQIFYLPGLVSGFNAVCRAIGQPGDGVIMQTPLYPPMLGAPANHGQILQMAELQLIEEANGTIRYEIDFDRFEQTITPQTKLFILCHPHNPTGVVFQPDELTRLAEICERHGIVICSDEIHCDLLHDDIQHTPMAAVSPEISANTITLMAPSKTFNVPGLACSFAIIQNPDLYKRLEQARNGIVPWVNILGSTAALAAYKDGDEWLTQVRAYLTVNRDLVTRYILEQMPSIRPTIPEATYLTWLDCRQSGIEGSPFVFFKNNAKVILNDGTTFGQAGQGFVRFNFATSRRRVQQALEQMKQALETTL